MVTFGKVTVAKTKANPAIAKAVFIANLVLTILYPIKTKGMFTTMINRGSGISVTAEINNEIPVAPPSIKLLVNKNPLNPNAAEKIPIVIKKKIFPSPFD